MIGLERIRMERRLTRAELATRAGVAVATIRNAEEGTREPNDPTLFKLADALECEPHELRAVEQAA